MRVTYSQDFPKETLTAHLCGPQWPTPDWTLVAFGSKVSNSHWNYIAAEEGDPAAPERAAVVPSQLQG